MNSKHWKSWAQRSLFPFMESILCFFSLWHSSPLYAKITEGILSQSPMYMLYFFLIFSSPVFVFYLQWFYWPLALWHVYWTSTGLHCQQKSHFFSPVVALHFRTPCHFSLKIHHFYVLLSLLKVIYLYSSACSNFLAWSSSIQPADLFELWYFLFVTIPVSDT